MSNVDKNVEKKDVAVVSQDVKGNSLMKQSNQKNHWSFT